MSVIGIVFGGLVAALLVAVCLGAGVAVRQAVNRMTDTGIGSPDPPDRGAGRP